MTPKEFIDYENDMRAAVEAFPELEMREAYLRFMQEIKKQEPHSMLRTDDESLQAAKSAILLTFRRPCTQPNCDGIQVLEGVCEGCIEGKAGYRSKWTCEKCMYRELSKKFYLDWYKELTKEK